MACYHPLKGYRSKDRNPSGKRSLVFDSKQGYGDLPIEVPCGQCIGCRLERSRQWALRCVHEASLYEDNCFLTLTYRPDAIPSDGSLHVEDHQLFMKRLRKEFSPRRIRFFHCGEYGEKGDRPHYHTCLFNFDFKDKEPWKRAGGNDYYTSKTLERLWPHGFSTVGSLTFESAAYVARYITKKHLGKGAEQHYESVDLYTGEIIQRKPEYITMSRRPGIGKGWYEKFKGDAYPSDFLIVRGKKMRPPKFYDYQLEAEDPEEFARVRAKRQLGKEAQADENIPERLRVKEWIKYDAMAKISRTYESEVDYEDVRSVRSKGR